MNGSDPQADPPLTGDSIPPPNLLSAFIEWRRRCLLAACAPEAVQRLQWFAWTRFDAFCRRYAPFPSPRVPHPLTPEASACWHLFETHLAVDRTRTGKRYKQWLFEAARAADGPPERRLTGGAALLMRDVVRDWLANDAPHPLTRSLQAPLGAGAAADAPTLEDLIPAGANPADEVAQRELEQLAAAEAAHRFPALDRRDRLLLAARARGLSLADTALERAVGGRKSTLYDRLRQLLQQLAKDLRWTYRDEDPAAVVALARLTLQELARRSLEKIIPEKSDAASFSMAKGGTRSKPARKPKRRPRAKGHAS